MALKKAVRSEQFLRISLGGPSGSGKTMTALRVAHALALAAKKPDSIALICSENGSGALYAGEPNADGGVLDYFYIDLSKKTGKFSPENYETALRDCAREGIHSVVIDSLSHAWSGPGGILEMVDVAAAKAKGNSFAGWKTGTPAQNQLVQAILSYPGHIIVTMRTKTEWVLESVNGRNVPRRVGMQMVQREGIEYEFTVVADIELDTQALTITKTRISTLNGLRLVRPGASLAEPMIAWLKSADAAPAPAQEPEPEREVFPTRTPPEGTRTAEPLDKQLESAESDPIVESEHHESWPADQKRFFARLAELGFKDSYEEVKEFCVWIKRPVPKKMEQDQRNNFLKFLGSKVGADKYGLFLNERDKFAAASGPGQEEK